MLLELAGFGGGVDSGELAEEQPGGNTRTSKALAIARIEPAFTRL